MPNLLASAVLFGWPLVVYFLFRRLPIPAALCWSILGGFLIIPSRVGIDLPLLPILDKNSIPILSASVMCLLASQPKTRRRGRKDQNPQGTSTFAKRQSRGMTLFFIASIILLLTPFFTAQTNPNALVYGPTVVPGLRSYDAFSLILTAGIMFLPFMVARKYLASPEDHAVVLKSLAFAGAGYAVLALFEIRMSPQLNVWIYGFFPHSFSQHMRGDGFRPLVFLPHGLWLGVFLSMSVLAAATLYRANKDAPDRGRWLMIMLWLFLVLSLSKNLGALMITLLLLPCILFTGLRLQILVAGLIALCMLCYPILRGSGLAPTDSLHSAVAGISAERAQSFKYRLDNEDILLEKARQKPLFGWGSWGRNRVYNTRTGEDISVTDGMWVITLGTSGWLGYLSQFGLLALPVVLLWWRRRTVGLTLYSSGLALALSANLIDLIPNAALSPVTWLLAGALAGRYGLQSFASADAADTAQQSRRMSKRGQRRPMHQSNA